MSGKLLPDNDHFARHCTGKLRKHFSQEADNGRSPPWLKGTVFEPDPQDGIVSVLWIEYHDGTWEQQLDGVRRELRDSKRTVAKTHQLAALQVKTVKEIGARYDRSLSMRHEPDNEQRLWSHVALRGIVLEDRKLQQRLADQALVVSAYIGPD